jgi:hypothetical protein
MTEAAKAIAEIETKRLDARADLAPALKQQLSTVRTALRKPNGR